MPGALAGVIPSGVPAAPGIPDIRVIALLLQRHADPDLFVMVQVSAGNLLQGRKNMIIHFSFLRFSLQPVGCDLRKKGGQRCKERILVTSGPDWPFDNPDGLSASGFFTRQPRLLSR